MTTNDIVDIEVPCAPVFRPLLEPARYKGAHGGRGSGKSHFFAERAVVFCLAYPKARIVCIREVQRSLKESVKLLVDDKIDKMGVGSMFKSTRDQIVTPGGGVILFQGMQEHNKESVKSLEGFDIAYCEEAQTLAAGSLEMLRPTIRNDRSCMKCKREDKSGKAKRCPACGCRDFRPASELWFSWNPRHASDPVDRLLRGPRPPSNSVVVEANWKDNPFFPQVLDEERKDDKILNPHRYDHIWNGFYEPAAIGAIWDRLTLQQHRRLECPPVERIVVAVDPPASHEEYSDEAGITVVAKGGDGRGYLVDDLSKAQATPEEWAAIAVAAYDAYEADAVVIEVNMGGDMVESTLRAVRPTLPIIKVRASRGKHVRAEPIAALYKLGHISHVGTYPELENQMVQTTADGYQGEGSPDRMDSMVWGFTELFPDMVQKVYDHEIDEYSEIETDRSEAGGY